MSQIPPLYTHQNETLELYRAEPNVYDASDPGTGKTRPAIQAVFEDRAFGAGPAIVFAPKSILKCAWAADIDKFNPGMTYAVATAENREAAFNLDVDIYITNLDATTWVAKHLSPKRLRNFSKMIVDEATAYKHSSSQRSKAAKFISEHVESRAMLSGLPNPNSILELHHQYLICDGGERLGKSYWKFRSTVCEPVQVGPRAEMVEWRDKPGVEAAVFDLLSDITIRHKLENCIQIPKNHQRTLVIDLPKKLHNQYDEMRRHALMIANDKTITAIHAASLNQKLLQIASGAVYAPDGSYSVLDNSRTELTMDLVEEVPHALVAFLWKHQRDALITEATKRGITYAVLDGDSTDRHDIVEAYQAGKLHVIFAHPQSAAHGITLTRGTRTIWPSPTYNPEWYKQFFHRIYRNGQDKETETIHIIGRNTLDERATERREGKLTNTQLLLDLMEAA